MRPLQATCFSVNPPELRGLRTRDGQISVVHVALGRVLPRRPACSYRQSPPCTRCHVGGWSLHGGVRINDTGCRGDRQSAARQASACLDPGSMLTFWRKAVAFGLAVSLLRRPRKPPLHYILNYIVDGEATCCPVGASCSFCLFFVDGFLASLVVPNASTHRPASRVVYSTGDRGHIVLAE